ncbi:biotin--[acetyl-CoA-carboxylase] ligase [Viscerimonas tarda]
MNAIIICVDELASTNSFLRDLCKMKELAEGTVVCAEFQTAGRGQKGNVWESEEAKNLLFSFVLYPGFIKVNEQFILSQLVSLAIKDALDRYVSDICIKWPNDIYWKDKKIAGILIENDLLDDKIAASIVGAGININQIRFVSDAPNPVSLKQITGQEYDRDKILNEILDKLVEIYELSQTNKKAISERYKQCLYRREGYFRFSDLNGEFDARIKDVADNGFLTLLTAAGLEKRYAFKEVRFI